MPFLAWSSALIFAAAAARWHGGQYTFSHEAAILSHPQLQLDLKGQTVFHLRRSFSILSQWDCDYV